MRYRPESTVQNGCGPLALAAILGGEDKQYTTGVALWRGRFVGMNDSEILDQLHKFKTAVYTRTFSRRDRRSLMNTLPLVGCGIVSCSRGHRHHALAFDGKMVYDTYSGGRWMWVYDHLWKRASVRILRRVETP